MSFSDGLGTSCGGCLGVVLVICLAFVGCGLLLDSAKQREAQRQSTLTPQQRDSEERQKKAQEDAANPATMEKYAKIETGMSYDEVVRLIGVQGEETSRVTIGRLTSVNVTWANSNFSSMTVIFQNDKVTAKAQVGLR